MYFSIIRKFLSLSIVLLLLCGRGYAAILGFWGAETGDTVECNSNVAQTNGTVIADTSFANNGKYSWQALVTASSNAPTLSCQMKTTSASATMTADYYLKVDAVPASMGSAEFEVAGLDVVSGTSKFELFVETTAGDVPSLQFYDAHNATQIGSTVPISFGTVYRIVIEANSGASGSYTGLVCTGPNYTTCTSEASGTINTGTGSWQFFQGLVIYTGGTTVNCTGGCQIHMDDLLITTTLADPGPHEVLARQFTGAGTYTSWIAVDGGGTCPGNWNATPFTASGTYCDNSISGSATCAAGATACQTGNTNFGSITGTGNSGFGSQVITTQTINAIKLASYGFTANQTGDAADSLVFIDSSSNETDTALGAWPGTTPHYLEVYPALSVTAAQLLGAQAGVKHGAVTISHAVNVLWLMVDAVPLVIGSRGVVNIP